MERYPEDIAISADDFNRGELEDAIKKTKRDDYSSLWHVLSDAASKAIDEERVPEGKVLWLLADACSMMLKPNSINEPFEPLMAMADGRRSALPEDFSLDDIELFAGIVDEITDARLHARLSDILWLLKKPRDRAFALAAINSYCKIPLDHDSWLHDGRDCWERAIQLCKMLKKGAGDKLHEIEDMLVSALLGASVHDGMFVSQLAKMLDKYGLGNDKNTGIADKLETLANECKTGDRSWHQCREYFELASQCFSKSDSPEKAAEMMVQVAECWVEEASTRPASASVRNMLAVHNYENAVHALRSIPKKYRNDYDVDKRISDVRSKLSVSGEGTLEELITFSSEPINLTEIIKAAVEAVSGNDFLDAIFAFVNIYQGVNVEKLLEHSRESQKQFFFSRLFSATHFSRDGRVVAKSPSSGLTTDDTQETLWPEMVRYHLQEISIIVKGCIWPALETLQQEHRIKLEDFHSVVSQSPIIPVGREFLFAKGLFSGYENDFIASLHILIPQIEHLIRVHLKREGVKTSHLDSNGVETENGLTTLMANEKANEIFGENLAFELRVLLCDPFGPNLRNELAHGLIGPLEAQSFNSVYLWWLSLRIIFNAYWKAATSDKSESASE